MTRRGAGPLAARTGTRRPGMSGLGGNRRHLPRVWTGQAHPYAGGRVLS